MEQLSLDYKTTTVYQTVYSASVQHEETAEVIVPDAQPDILRFVETEAVAFMRTKEGDRGQVRVSGTAEAVVLYLPDGTTGVRKLETSVPFTVRADAPEMAAECLISAKVTVAGAEARMINPRKIMLRIDLLVEFSCCTETELKIAAGASDADKASAELLVSDTQAMMLSEVTEKTFLISDEVTVSGMREMNAELLRTRVLLNPGETAAAENRILLKGEAVIELLYRSEEGLGRYEHTVPYSQTVEFENSCEGGVFDVSTMLTGAYLNSEDGEAGSFGLELHAVAQCARYEAGMVSYIADVYSTRYAMACEMQRCVLRDLESVRTLSAPVRANVESSTPVKSVISVNACTGQPQVRTAVDGAEIAAPVELTVIYETEDGRILSTVQKLQAVTAGSAAADGICQVSGHWNGEYHTAVTAAGADIRLSVDFTVRQFRMCTFSAVDDASYDPDSPADSSDKPSMVLRRYMAGESAWMLAKKYSSTRALLLETNGLASEQELSPGMMLLIPRKR